MILLFPDIPGLYGFKERGGADHYFQIKMFH